MMQPRLSLERLLTHCDGFGLEQATDVQRAICRVSDGWGIEHLWHDERVRATFGGVMPPSGKPPKIMTILSGIRGAKSAICAGKSIQASQCVDLSCTKPGDEVRIPILAVDKDVAHVVLSHLINGYLRKPALAGLLIGDPKADSVMVRHPSGMPVEIKVTAISKYASTLVGRWLAAVIFDEAPRMAGEGDGVRNLTESLDSIAGRMLGQIMLPGSPWAPMGPVYDMYTASFGKPSPDLVIAKARGSWLNPSYWTPAKIADIAQSNPRAHQTDELAEFADPEEAMFPSDLLGKCLRAGELEPEPGLSYCAAMDPATRANAWTFVVFGMSPEGVIKQCVARQWTGSKLDPLRPRAVIAEIAGICRSYGIDVAHTDQYSFDALNDLADQAGITLLGTTIRAENRLEMFEGLRLLMQTGRVELIDDPLLRSDMQGVRKRITQNGVTIVLPVTGDGRHADYAPSVALAVSHPPMPPEMAAPEREIDEDMQRALDGCTAQTGNYWGVIVQRALGKRAA